MKEYRKALVAVVGAVISVASVVWGFETDVTAEEIVAVLCPILTALGVWGFRNG